MNRALQLAIRGQGGVEPNPMVGAVLVRKGRVIGEGWHERFGGAHAEVDALEQARSQIGKHGLHGATLYVTLEPCCHWGKTPPCTDAVIAAGVSRVVAAMRDPFPKVAGGGFRKLRHAGIRVETGLMQEEARQLNAPFLKRLESGRPWVILKWAQSLDGKIATHTGVSRWISSPQSRREAHVLRGRVDAVIVGVGTVLADNPELTSRHVKPRRVATRVVLDSRLRIPLECELVRTARTVATLVVTSRGAPAVRRRRLERAGCEVMIVPRGRSGLSISFLLEKLGRRGMTNVLVEGGAHVLGSFFDARLADEAFVFVAPKLIGGAAAPGPLGQRGMATMDALPRTSVIESRPSGPDLLWRLRF